MGEYAVSGTSLMTFTYCLTAYSSLPSKFPWHRKTHHWWTLCTLISSFQTTFRSYITSLLYLLGYAFAAIFYGWRYLIWTEQNAPTPFRRLFFLDESWTCRYFFACSSSVPHQHQIIYLELHRIKLWDDVNILYTSQGTQWLKTSVAVCHVNIKLYSSYTGYNLIAKFKSIWLN